MCFCNHTGEKCRFPPGASGQDKKLVEMVPPGQEHGGEGAVRIDGQRYRWTGRVDEVKRKINI
jgi:hypothetical protein